MQIYKKRISTIFHKVKPLELLPLDNKKKFITLQSFLLCNN